MLVIKILNFLVSVFCYAISLLLLNNKYFVADRIFDYRKNKDISQDTMSE